LDCVVRLIKAYPEITTEIESNIGKCLFPRFPYSLVRCLEVKSLRPSQQNYVATSKMVVMIK